MIPQRETHDETLDRIEAMLREFPYPSHRDVQSSASTINVNGGGWLNAAALVFMGALALAMFILYLSDRNAAASERAEFKQQTRVDVQRLDGALNRQAEKLETHDAYINDMFRRMKDK